MMEQVGNGIETLALVWELQPDMEGIEATAKIETAYPNQEGVVVKKTAMVDELMKIINKKIQLIRVKYYYLSNNIHGREKS